MSSVPFVLVLCRGSKHVKGSKKERDLLGQNIIIMQIFGVIPFIKLQHALER